MHTKKLNPQFFVLIILSLIPWPGPTIFKISCPRDSSRIVRNIVKTKWIPILEKYKVTLPLECPFHPLRDIFGPQQRDKHQHRPSQWTCGLCGKSFFEEQYLDKHFENRHKNHINVAEDAVCLADYCDIMRCDVLVSQDPKLIYPDLVNTDIEIWNEVQSHSNALATSAPRDLAKYNLKNGGILLKTKISNKNVPQNCQKSNKDHDSSQNDESNQKNEEDKSQNVSTNNICKSSDLVDSALPSQDKHRQQRIAEIQKLKANCRPETLQKIKTKCEILVRDCIASLLIQLDVKDFKEVEDELNRAVCWYLTCDRYWEDFPSDLRTFPWGLLCMIIMVLSLGICLCYYVIWVLFDVDDGSVSSMTDRSTPSPHHLLMRDHAHSSGDHAHYGEDYFLAPDKENEYIYVTYPPDLKRRLLESCYNRTTRL